MGVWICCGTVGGPVGVSGTYRTNRREIVWEYRRQCYRALKWHSLIGSCDTMFSR